ncbi:guanylate kinase [Nitrolancea hollandica]|uniref:Guanylate kinase n=1 Tax=Nitrolancea hollandica Lb TaxID=1129897 RepID=I4EGQ0_9BACT|nr:guanylate kinase [Nitrolancea hollandica]CCF83862.1 Guanylate kinase (GMP kinase) [Nitrolancea hollandica Lb]
MSDEGRLNAKADELIEELRSIARPRLIVISGPSGVGKDTIIEQMRLAHPEYAFIVTATTRPRRPGEIDGVHYYFMSPEEFRDLQARNEFLESAEVYGNFYGVPRGRIRKALANGKNVVVKVDVQGAASIRKIVPTGGVFIFLVPPSMAELIHRLRSRKTDEPEVLMERIATASRELERAREFDYVVFNENGSVDKALAAIDAIIAAENARINQARLEL